MRRARVDRPAASSQVVLAWFFPEWADFEFDTRYAGPPLLVADENLTQRDPDGAFTMADTCTWRNRNRNMWWLAALRVLNEAQSGVDAVVENGEKGYSSTTRSVRAASTTTSVGRL